MKIRILASAFTILTALVTAGCGPIQTFRYQAPPAYTRQPEPPALGKIGVVAAEFPPQTDFNALLSNHQSAVVSGGTAGAAGGAAIGAGVGALAVLTTLGACLNPAAAATCPSVGAYAAGGAAIGGAAGAVAGKATEKEAKGMEVAANVKDVAGSISEALQSLHMQQSVRERVIEYGAATTNLSFVSLPSPGPATPDERRDYTALRDSGVDSIVEVAVLKTSLGREGGMWDIRHGRLIMTARARLIQVSDGHLMHEADYRFVSEPMFHVQLAADDAAGFKQAFDRAYQDMAEQIVDRLFLIYEPPLSGKETSGRCILAPLRPEYPKSVVNPFYLCRSCYDEGVRDLDPIFGNNPFATVNSLQPELRWESFPTQEEQKADQTGELSTLADVRYEVRVYAATLANSDWPSFGWVPGMLIDSHTTTIASHRPETPLKACGHYFWTFRAHFTLNGQPRVTEWAGVRDQGLVECWDIVPRYPPSPRMFYPFKTECPQPAK